MTPVEYWTRWAVALTVFIFCEYWVVKWAIIAALKHSGLAR